MYLVQLRQCRVLTSLKCQGIGRGASRDLKIGLKISQDRLRTGAKADLLECLESIGEIPGIRHQVGAIVLDRAVIVSHKAAARGCEKTGHCI